MEPSSSIVIVMAILAFGGVASGAYMMADGSEWTGGHFGMMGGSTGMMSDHDEECPGYDGEHPEDCHEEFGEHPEECEEHFEEDCPYHVEGKARGYGGGC
jgi:hypothetical protein